MATTKIWPVHDSLKRLVDYAGNPEKTEFNGLQNALHYAEDQDKTENFYFVSGINCDPDNAYEQMVSVKKSFGKTDGNLAYHAYQSFLPGEITPQQCHDIGVELARTLWGKNFQVLVATHLDKDHLHNHFLINSVSHVNGKKFNCNQKAYYQMRDTSDLLCEKYGLSVIKTPKGKTPRSIYFAEKSGEPTQYNMMREAIKTAMESSRTADQFVQVIRSLGYEFSNGPNRKYSTIKAIGSKKAVRLCQLGEDYDIPAINRRLELNRRHTYGSPFITYCRSVAKKQNGTKMFSVRVKRPPKRKIGGLLGLYYHYCYLLGCLPKGTTRKPLSPEMKAACRKLDRTTAQIRLIGKYHLTDTDTVRRFIEETSGMMGAIEARRDHIYNRLRRCDNEEEVALLKSKRDSCTAQLSVLRKERKTASQILEDIPKIRDGIKQEQQVKSFQQQLIRDVERKRDYER